MPTVLQLRRGTTAQNEAFTGSAGELTFNTTTGAIRAHDGSTAGGAEMLVNDGSNAATTVSMTNLTLSGNLTVSGTTTTVSTTNTVITDNLIELNNGAASNANDSGIVIERGSTGDNAFIGWDESADQFIVGTTTATGASTGDLTITAAKLTVATPTADSDAATKGYIDTALSSLSSNSISEGNTSITVTDSGTGSIVAAVDGSTHTTFNSSGITLSTGNFVGTATQAQYADLAEKYSADAEYSAGTVLQFGGEAEVTVATQFASRRVAGVVSTDPAYMMNSEAEGVYVALAGRVPCRVVGVVTKGDLMVSSNTPGCAVAWGEELRDPPAGSIIGKALENKSGQEEGVIEVVVGVR